MGGEIVGNQSVYWRMTHRDKAGNKKKLKCQVPDVTMRKLPDPDTIHVSDEAFAHDDIPFDEIGKNWKKGYFKVILRFPDNASAVTELERALTVLKAGKGRDATLFVLAVPRPSSDVDPAKPPAEIEIDW